MSEKFVNIKNVVVPLLSLFAGGAVLGSVIWWAATTTISANTQYKHYITEFSSSTPMTFSGISGVYNCRIYRDPTVSGDTYAHDVFAHEVDFHYEQDTLGSRTEYTK